MELVGVDFTSRPSRRKAITAARGEPTREGFRLERVERLTSFEAFEVWLARPGPWTGAFDLPFGLPRAFVLDQGWPTTWLGVVETLARLDRSELRARCRAYCDVRPPGAKLAHRATDRVALSSSSMKWVNPPVVFMLHEALPRLVAANVSIPGLFAGDPRRIALEGYPALLAKEITRAPYKNDDVARQTAAQRLERRRIVAALCRGETRLGVRLSVSKTLERELVDEPMGDALDAVLCAIQATWAHARRDARHGLPEEMDPLEGWIVTAQPPVR